MALKVIGSGLGRTGTMSLKLALERLGLESCHHMVEVFMHPESVPLWMAAGEGRLDWEAIFAGYQSAVDYPGARFWRQLAEYYPQAKVIHTVRDPEQWFESTHATIFAPNSLAAGAPEPMRGFFAMVTSEFGGRLHDRDFMLDYVPRHTAELIATVPRDRLLVFDVSEGWGPLGDFLGVAAPETPFPRENSRAQFQARVAGAGADRLPDPAAVKAILDSTRQP